jgi:hypothetical protein
MKHRSIDEIAAPGCHTSGELSALHAAGGCNPIHAVSGTENSSHGSLADIHAAQMNTWG